jgi:2-dehydro-3-deoxyphosphogluconate aldolase/(4S)-4-hydroxy-2-oxoglutarate aldolase
MLDCTLLKFFPAEATGGVAMLKALHAPYKHRGVRFIPTGGITAANVGGYLAEPSVVAVGGSWMTAGLKERNWPEITTLAREAVAARPGPPFR